MEMFLDRNIFIASESDDTRFGNDGSRQFFDMMSFCYLFLVDEMDDFQIQRTIGVALHIDCYSSLKGFCTCWIHPDIDRAILVERLGIFEVLLFVDIDIQAQVGDDFLYQCTAFQNFYFIVKVVGHGQHSHVGQCGDILFGSRVARTFALIFFNDDRTVDTIYWALKPQEYIGSYKANEKAGEKPMPI